MKSMLLRFTLFFLFSVQMSGQNYSHEKLDSLNQHISAVILSREAISRVELDHAIHLSTKAQYSEGIALGYKNIGNFYYFQSKHDSAILFLEKGIRSLKEPYSPVRSRLLMNLGVNNEKLYRFEEAISYYLKALRVSKYNADSASVAITYQNLAQVKSRVQDYSEAKLALDSCLEWAPSLGFNKAAVYSSLGSILNSLGDTSSSINSYQKALKTWPVNRNLREKAVLLNNYSNVLIQQKKFNEARENYSAARIVFEQLNDHEGLASNIIGYANLEYFDSNYSKALTLYQEAYELENIGTPLQISLLTNIELSAFKLGEYEIAHTALAKKFLLVDSIAVFDSRAALDSIQSVYAINDLKEQAKEEQLLSEQEKLKLSRAIGWLSTILLIISILVFILVQRRKYLKLQLSEAEKAGELALLQGISRGEDAERQRFAEELHDSLGSQIGALHLKLSSDNVDEEKLKQLESIGDDVRRISHDLLPPQIENGNLSLALEKLFLFNHSEECSFYFHSHNDLNSLGNAHFDLQLYRVFQELIRNTVKHSKAKEAHLSVWKEEEKWVFEYEDNGVGMPKNATPGLGTQTIQSRLNKIGASFHLDSKPNKGIRIGITVNLDHA